MKSMKIEETLNLNLSNPNFKATVTDDTFHVIIKVYYKDKFLFEVNTDYHGKGNEASKIKLQKILEEIIEKTDLSGLIKKISEEKYPNYNP